MVPSGPRRRHVQEPRGIEEALRGQGHHRQQGHCHLLPYRREILVHMVRAKVSPRLPKRAKLRRFMDRMGKPRSESNREAEPIDGTRRSSIKYRINLSLFPAPFLQAFVSLFFPHDEMEEVSLLPPVTEHMTSLVRPPHHLHVGGWIICNEMNNVSDENCREKLD